MSAIIDRLDSAADTLEARHWRTDADERSQLQHALVCVLAFGTPAMLVAWLLEALISVASGRWFFSLWPFTTPLAVGIACGWAFYAWRELSWRVSLIWSHRYYMPRAVQQSLRIRDGIQDVLVPVAFSLPAASAAFATGDARFGVAHWCLSLAVLLGYTTGPKVAKR